MVTPRIWGIAGLVVVAVTEVVLLVVVVLMYWLEDHKKNNNINLKYYNVNKHVPLFYFCMLQTEPVSTPFCT